MKKLILFLIVAMSVSCASSARLVNTATHSKSRAVQPVTALYADLDVSPTKISYFFIPSKIVTAGGYDNVINTAVREALAINNNADVMVALETQVKYDYDGQIESVVITGYPATYTNFRNASDEVLSNLVNQSASTPNSNSNSPLGLFKFGKK